MLGDHLAIGGDDLASLLLQLLSVLGEISLDELVNIAIKDLVYIACFKISAMIFYHFIGMQHIAANLIAPFGINSFSLEFGFFFSI